MACLLSTNPCARAISLSGNRAAIVGRSRPVLNRVLMAVMALARQGRQDEGLHEFYGDAAMAMRAFSCELTGANTLASTATANWVARPAVRQSLPEAASRLAPLLHCNRANGEPR
jgi:hypothetical protein